MDTPVPRKAPTIDQMFQRVKVLERRLMRWVALTWILALCLLVAVTGWWFTSRDNGASKEYDRKADCRAVALADVLDQFRVLVIPSADEDDKNAAELQLDLLGSLEDAYRRCDRK